MVILEVGWGFLLKNENGLMHAPCQTPGSYFHFSVEGGATALCGGEDELSGICGIVDAKTNQSIVSWGPSFTQ